MTRSRALPVHGFLCHAVATAYDCLTEPSTPEPHLRAHAGRPPSRFIHFNRINEGSRRVSRRLWMERLRSRTMDGAGSAGSATRTSALGGSRQGAPDDVRRGAACHDG